MCDGESDFLQSAQDVVSLGFEMPLQCLHLLAHIFWFKHGNCSFLKRNVGTAVKVGAARADCANEIFWTNDPSDSPSWKPKALGQSVNKQYVVLIHVLDIVCRADGGSVAIASVIVSAVKLVHDECCPVTANVLDFGKFWVFDDLTGRVARIRCQNYRCSSGDFLRNLVRMDVIAIFLG